MSETITNAKTPWRTNFERTGVRKSLLNTEVIDLKSLCGFYRFVYDSWTGIESGLDDDDDVYSYLKLTATKPEDDDKVVAVVSGSFLWWDKIGT